MQAMRSLVFMTRGYGASEKISISCDNPNLAMALGITADTEDPVTATGLDTEVSLGEQGFAKTATATSEGDIVTIKDSNGFEMKYKITPGTARTSFTDASGDGMISAAAVSSGGTEVVSTLLSVGSLFLQVGTNEGQTMEVKIPRLDSETLGIKYANVGTHESASRAISLFDNAVNFVSSIRSKLGSYQNRLEHTVTNLDTAGYNVTESMSRIMDADMAEEMTEYTQQNVLQQAGTAILAQANERPQNILSLLNG